ncbi:MAG TPA: hypothetical protein VIG08_15835 [Gemmatimonadales bacterium]|jgi:hypothetical protein
MVGRMIAVAALLVLAACGGGDGITPPDPIDVEGTWDGTFQADSQDVSLTLNLTESNGTVNGDGTLITSAGTFPLTITGTYDSPRLALAITTPGFDLVSLVAIVGKDSMTGTIGGGGFDNQIFTLDRQ